MAKRIDSMPYSEAYQSHNIASKNDEILSCEIDNHLVLCGNGRRKVLLLDELGQLAWGLYQLEESHCSHGRLYNDFMSRQIDEVTYNCLRQSYTLFDKYFCTPDPIHKQISFFDYEGNVAPNPNLYSFDVSEETFFLQIEDETILPELSSVFTMSRARIENLKIAAKISGYGPWKIHTTLSTIKCLTLEDLVVELLALLHELGSKCYDRLITLHSASLVNKTSNCLVLLIGESGSGKSTLSAYLQTKNYDLINDDVLPLNHNAEPIELKLPSVFKEGSWDFLSSFDTCMLDIKAYPRRGANVKFKKKGYLNYQINLSNRIIIFSRYDPNAVFSSKEISAHEILANMISAGAVLPGMNQYKLENIVKWIKNSHGFEMHYSNAEEALCFIDQQSQRLSRLN